ncbi:transforming growth factor beta receptor type 3 isoform X2 [Oryzias latipes]|uniref:transforming growth factor beta receptor type 3 isoform X2 n=1 Tax=Oryzias latipes TaxID=8090 RepID=UPI0005CC23DF|nr:transforming growth factor beta receptor type 3 isoform X2 [Oryzias latipes]
MRSLSEFGWTFFHLLLLLKILAARGTEVTCRPAGPAGEQHPVQALLEKFEAGPGCAAREHGNKETHVVATTNPQDKMAVMLQPLSPSPHFLRSIHLVLSSKFPITWFLQNEGCPPNLSVWVQVSANSTVQSHNLNARVQTLASLPFRPFSLHLWALKYHGSLSSLIHTVDGNRAYIRLGEDPSLPAVCRLQSTFLSRNYMASDLQPQEVHGCAFARVGGDSPEVHVIKLHAAGSGLRGSLQVEVTVSLLPAVAASKAAKVVLILSSLVPVTWVVVARGVQGHVTVHSSSNVTPPYPPEPGLTLSSTLHSDLPATPDLITWANESGYSKVTSCTEADLANRFVIQLTEEGADGAAGVKSFPDRPPWAEERRLRQWLNTADGAAGGRESFTVTCEAGRLSVTLDKNILQGLSVPVAAVTLQNTTCQAEPNVTHFLLDFPVISCGTTALKEPRGVRYTNMVLLWRDRPQTNMTFKDMEKSKRPLSIQFSCLSLNSSSRPAAAADGDRLPAELIPWESDPGITGFPAPRLGSGPALLLKLFVSQNYEQTWIGPCVVTADQRVYIEISAKISRADVLQVKSCFVSPLSDPQKSPFWIMIKDGCSSDPSLTLNVKANDEEEEEEGLEDETSGVKISRTVPQDETQSLRFSFLLRPIFNNSVQFLHCSLRLCLPDLTKEEAKNEAENSSSCHGGMRIPPLTPGLQRHECQIRNLSRPMVVTHPISSLLPRMQAHTGQRAVRPRAPPEVRPDPELNGLELQTGTLMGIIFAAFAMGTCLMGALWCIFAHTGGQAACFREALLTEQTHGGGGIRILPRLSDQNSSSV